MANDLISRQAAIDALGGNEPVGDPSKMDDDDVVKMWERIRIINIINKLPSAEFYTEDEIQKIQDLEQAEIQKAYELGRKEAQSERKKGKWIPHLEVKNIYGGTYIECSECGEKYVVQHMEDEKFCRHCGADMRGREDE